VCDDDGDWGDGEDCDVGICSTLGGPVGTRDAGCILECIPGAKVCTGAVIAASDGVSTGYAQEAECDDDGLLGAPEDCDDETACRITSIGEHIGCVECLGPEVLGGNEWGYEDTRCDPDDLEQVQGCDDDNEWDESRECDDDRVCRQVNGDTCGSCSINGTLMPCTETNLELQPRCGPCTDATLLATATQCRNALIVSLSTSTETCESLFGDGSAVAGTSQPDGTAVWGGYNDCCDGMSATGADGEFLINDTCALRGYGTPVPAGAPDCCSIYVTPGVGPAFAYCAIP
jgi:hypothetical protein